VAAVKFNATGIMAISQNPDVAVVGEANGTALGTVNPNFNRHTQINLATLAVPAIFYAASGADAENDVIFAGNGVVASAQLGATKGAFRYNIGGGAPIAQAPLPTSSYVRLAVDGNNHWLLATIADQHRVVRLDLTVAALAVDPKYRLPVQLLPFDIAFNAVRGEIYVLNLLSCTVSAATASVVLGAAPPAYTVEPPITLSDYRGTILQAYADLLGKAGQFLKDAFCEQFLIDCPDCRKDTKVYLGCVEIAGSKVYKICNFSQRRYVKTVRLVEYWLSTVPILPVLKQLFANFCCKVL
jgi:hypothetical protein